MIKRYGVLILSILVAALVIYALISLKKQVPLSAGVEERQNLPPESPLELPPMAPIPSSRIVFPNAVKRAEPAAPSPSPSERVRPPTVIVHKPAKIPTQWEIVNDYRQVIRLDIKYLQIAVTSDRYGYHNQAILYYKKYLSIAPSSPYADRVRNRLSQLEAGG